MLADSGWSLRSIDAWLPHSCVGPIVSSWVPRVPTVMYARHERAYMDASSVTENVVTVEVSSRYSYKTGSRNAAYALRIF